MNFFLTRSIGICIDNRIGKLVSVLVYVLSYAHLYPTFNPIQAAGVRPLLRRFSQVREHSTPATQVTQPRPGPMRPSQPLLLPGRGRPAEPAQVAQLFDMFYICSIRFMSIERMSSSVCAVNPCKKRRPKATPLQGGGMYLQAGGPVWFSNFQPPSSQKKGHPTAGVISPPVPPHGGGCVAVPGHRGPTPRKDDTGFSELPNRFSNVFWLAHDFDNSNRPHSTNPTIHVAGWGGEAFFGSHHTRHKQGRQN